MSEGVLICKRLAVGHESSLLEGLDLVFRAGEITAIHGPSGLGKTTLLRTLSGLCDPREGSLELLGKAPAQWGWPAYRRKVVLVAQRPTLLKSTVRDSLRRPFQYRSAKSAEFPEELVTDLLQSLGLKPSVLDDPGHQLSLGEQQRVCLVRGLALNPRALLLDEPTSALDHESLERVDKVLRKSASRGVAVILASHQKEWIEELSDRQISLKEYRP